MLTSRGPRPPWEIMIRATTSASEPYCETPRTFPFGSVMRLIPDFGCTIRFHVGDAAQRSQDNSVGTSHAGSDRRSGPGNRVFYVTRQQGLHHTWAARDKNDFRVESMFAEYPGILADPGNGVR